MIAEDIRVCCLRGRMGAVMGPDHTDELDADNTVQEVQQINLVVKRNKTARRDGIWTDVRSGRCWLSKTNKLKLQLIRLITLNVRKKVQSTTVLLKM